MIPVTRRRVGYHQAATLAPCPSCRRHVLTGRQFGSVVVADAGNVSAAGELQARIQNRATYDLFPDGYPPRLYFRWRGLDEIRAARRFAVVADHKCGKELPSEPAPKYSGLLVPVSIQLPDVPSF